MTWGAVGGAAVGVVGGLLTKNKGGGQTVSKDIDPRIAQYLYGSNGNGGLLNSVNNTYAQQSATGGLNPMQNAGLELQRQTLMDPRYTQGFDQMRNLGGGLMSQGVAGNPFTNGMMALGGPSMGGMGNLNTPYVPNSMQIPQQPSRMQAMGMPPNPQGFQPTPYGMNSTTAPAYQQIMPQQAAPQQTLGADEVRSLLDDMKKKAPAPTPTTDFDSTGG